MTENEIPKERNPVTHQAHRREVFWQITLPIILGVSIILGLAIWTIVYAAQGGGTTHAAGTSLIFLIIPTMIMGLVLLVSRAGFAYAVIWLNQNLPPYAKQVQDIFDLIKERVRYYADRLVEPVLRWHSTQAGISALGRKTKKRETERS
jgi:hypothetical protein